MPQRSQHRMAVSKASLKEMPSSVKSFNLVSNDVLCKPEITDHPPDLQPMF